MFHLIPASLRQRLGAVGVESLEDLAGSDRALGRPYGPHDLGLQPAKQLVEIVRRHATIIYYTTIVGKSPAGSNADGGAGRRRAVADWPTTPPSMRSAPGNCTPTTSAASCGRWRCMS